MVEPEKANSTDLESTVRHLREENAKLMQLLRARGLLNDVPLCPTNKSSDPQSSTFSQTSESSSVTFDHSDHQFVNNSSSIHQQNYHGNSSSLTPNFNTVIQNSTQPFVQNNTNLIQPINLVNINNVSLESIQSIFSGQNNLVYLSQSSSNTTTTTTTTTATSSSSSLSSTTSSSSSSSSSSTVTTSNSNLQESTPTSSLDSHQISIRPKPSLLHPHQELVPVVPKIRAEQYESITRQYSSSSITNETSNLLDNDSNDSKQKYPRPIRPKPSSRSNSLQLYKSMVINETHSNPSPTVSLFSSSPTSTSNSFVDQQHSSNIDETSLNNGNSKKSSTNSSNKNRSRNRTKTSTTSSTPVPIAPNFVAAAAAAGRPLAPAPVNVQRSITSNNPITKRSNTSKKRPNKGLVQCHSESLLSNVSSPTNTFADSISGFLEDFNQELLKSNILSQDSQTTNLLTDESTTNSVRTTTLDNIDLRNLVNGAIQRHESYQSTLDEYPTEQNSNPNEIPSIQEFHSTENEPIGPFMSEEDMRFVEMNFDENTFLKHFDLDDPGLRLNVQSDQNLFSNLLTNSHSHIDFASTEQSAVPPPPPTTTVTNTIVPISTPTPSMYSGSSLINNNVFTTVVPLGLQHQSSSSQIKTTIINQTNLSSFLPEEGVQLTARHIEPRQVATYESVKYQDILDDLVMVTDQDALQHAQAAAANDPSIVSTDFTYALIEATNQIIKDPHIQVLQATTAATTATFNDLQYFYPIEHEQELLQKQLETCAEKSNDVEQNPNESIVILEKLQAEILVSADLTKTVLDDSLIQTAITDLSSLLQLEPTETLPPMISQPTTTTIEEIPVHRSPPAAPRDPTPPPPPPPPPAPSQLVQDNQPIDFDAFFSSEPSPPKAIETEMNTSFTDHLLLTSNPVVQQEQEEEPTPMPIEPVGTVAPKPCILFEPILSPTPCVSPEKPKDEEIIIDEGSIGQFNTNESVSPLNKYQLEALLNGETYHPDPYSMIESPQPIESEIRELEHDDVEEEDEEEEEETIVEHQKFVPTFEYTFNRYREKHRLKMKREKENRMKKNAEQSLTVPPVKLKLNAIFLQKSSSSQKKKKRRSKSPSPSSRSIPPISISLLPRETEPVSTLPMSIKEPIDEKPIERPPLKITIRTKLPLPPPPPPTSESVVITPVQQDESKKIRKSKKKKSHPSTQPSKKKSNPTNVERVETEYAGLTRFERPLAQLYHQTRPPTPDENQLKHEIQTPSPPVASLPSIDSNPIQSNNPHPHSGFMIDEQTPPSSITSIEHKNSPPPLLSSQTVNEKLKLNYSHLFTYDHQHHEQQNNNTFITPPPETDFHPQQQQQHQHQQQQKNHSFDNFFPFTASPSKKRHQSRKSSVTSSTSSKSLPTTEYAIDSQALEPVSPTPLSSTSSSSTTGVVISSKSKHSTTSSASTTPTPSISSSTSNFNEIPSTFFDSHQSKSNKDSHSSNKKSSSSSSSTSSSSSSNRSSKTNPSQSSSSSSSYPTSRSLSNHSYRTNTDSSVLPPMLPPSIGSTPSSLHLDPYAQSYHHFAPRASAASFFNFPFPHPFLNPHATTAPPAAHFHPHHSMKYHPAHHAYPAHHQSTYPYHPHLPRQQQYNNSNYMSSRDHHHHHHPFER